MSDGYSVSIRDVYKTYRRGRVQALRGASLDVPSGQVLGLVGPNGAGKSTLLACLMGMARVDDGSIRIADRDPQDLVVRSGLGWLPERPSFPVGSDARGCVQFHLGLLGVPRARRALEAEVALDRVGLPRESRGRSAARYSQGMKQRLGLALALLGRPRLLLLDEPATGLDPIGVVQLRDLVQQERDRGATIILNSHQLDEVARTCDVVAFLRDGTVREIQAPGAGGSLEKTYLEVMS